MWATNFLQLTVKPSGEATSSLHTTSIFGLAGKTQSTMREEIDESLAMVVVHVSEEDRVHLRRKHVDLREPQQRAAANIELQPHRTAIVGVIAVTDERARARLTLVGLRPALRAGDGDRQARRRLRPVCRRLAALPRP